MAEECLSCEQFSQETIEQIVEKTKALFPIGTEPELSGTVYVGSEDIQWVVTESRQKCIKPPYGEHLTFTTHSHHVDWEWEEARIILLAEAARVARRLAKIICPDKDIEVSVRIVENDGPKAARLLHFHVHLIFVFIGRLIKVVANIPGTLDYFVKNGKMETGAAQEFDATVMQGQAPTYPLDPLQ